jgi:sugar phosphate permease
MKGKNFETEKKKVMKYRWIIYSLLSAVYFLANFHKFSTGVMQDELINSFNLSTAAFGNLSSMVFYSYLIMQIPSGLLADTLGARMTVTAGCIVTALGSFLFAAAQGAAIANISRFVIGIGISVTYISLIKIQTKWFLSREFATMTGLTFLLGNLGSVLAQTPLRMLADMFSWRSIYFVFGAMSVFMGILTFIIIRNSPEDMGLPSIESIEGKTVTINPNKEKIKIRSAVGKILLNRYNWPTFAVVFSLGAILSILSGSFGSVYIRDTYGVSMVEASRYTMILTLALAIGSTILGLVSDRFRKRKIFMLILNGAMTAVWIYIVVISKGEPAFDKLKMLYMLTGLSLSSCLLSYTVAKESNDLTYAGLSVSFIGLMEFIGSAVGPVMVGKIIDMNPSLVGGELYSRAFIVLAVLSAVTFSGTLFVKETNGENITAADSIFPLKQ